MHASKTWKFFQFLLRLRRYGYENIEIPNNEQGGKDVAAAQKLPILASAKEFQKKQVQH